MTTIEHNTYRFWDWDSMFPGESVSDAFEKAGGRVEYLAASDLIVQGLDFETVTKIARSYNADYMGPVIVKDRKLHPMKDVTPLSKPSSAVKYSLSR